jgi:hypothetical protein
MKYEPRPIVPINPAGIEDVAEALSAPAQENNSSSPMQIQARINPRDYIKVGINGLHGKPVVISRFELIGSNEKNYENANRFVLEKGLYVPTPKIFMKHFMNVMAAKQGLAKLYDGSGNEITGNDLDDIYKHLTKDHIAVFGSQSGAWTWLNAGFNDGKLETIMGINSNGTFQIKREPLENCLNENAYITFNFNSQGLASPSSKDSNQSYLQGKNIYFYKPVQGAVARFDADSRRAYLDCVRNPTGANASLGVFASAEGASAV